MERLSLEKVFHPFIAGAHNRLVQELSQETGARISIPPPSLPKDEIVITGEKEAVALALNRIRAIYEDKVTTRAHFRLPYFPDYKSHFFFFHRLASCDLYSGATWNVKLLKYVFGDFTCLFSH